MILKKVISGGQTGADQAGLVAAKKCGIVIGGTAPPNFMTDNGSMEILKEFGLVEGEPDPRIYPKRTIKNAQDADGTVWFGKETSPGGRLTLGNICQNNKPTPCINPKDHIQLAKWIIENNIQILNVAGNRERTNPGIGNKVETILIKTFKLLEKYEEKR